MRGTTDHAFKSGLVFIVNVQYVRTLKLVTGQSGWCTIGTGLAQLAVAACAASDGLSCGKLTQFWA